MKNSIVLSLILFIPFFISAQCDKLDNHPDGKEAALKLFVYRDYVKAKDYEQAFPLWEELYKCCKAGNGNILKDGITMCRSFSENTLNHDKKHTYHLKMVQLMEERVACYGHRIRTRTGLPYYGFRYYEIGKHYYKNLEDYGQAAYYFEKALEADGNLVERNLINYYVVISKKQLRNEEITYDSLGNLVRRLAIICDSDTNKFKDTKVNLYDEFQSIRVTTFDCDYFVDKIKPNYDKNKHDKEYLISVIKDLKRFRCDENHPFLLQAIEDYKSIPEHCGSEPTERELKDFMAFFKKGIENDSIPIDKRFRGAMRLGRLYQQNKEWKQALKYYKRAVELNPNSGEPYIAIGMLYLSANKSCSGFDRQLVAGGALDQFRIAKKYKDTKEEAIEKIATYSKYLPTREILFQRRLKIGEEITAGCVLSVRTTIQVR